MSFKSIGEVIQAELDGKVRNYRWRKTPSAATGADMWSDLAVTSGNPPAAYWFASTPLVSKPIYQSDQGGIYHGPNVSPSKKYLRSILTQHNRTSTGTFNLYVTAVLCDYLMYYPTIDEGTTDVQTMTNTYTLPRYESGEGVQMILVTTALRTGNPTLTINYTNSDGNSKTTGVITLNSVAATGTVANSANTAIFNSGLYVPLASGDKGVRSVESVTMLTTDVGLFSILLVKPLAQTMFMDRNSTTAGVYLATPNEKDFLLPTDTMPQIYDDAFLNFFVLPQESLQNSQLTGDLKVIWT
jgi:hypothetical protein